MHPIVSSEPFPLLWHSGRVCRTGLELLEPSKHAAVRVDARPPLLVDQHQQQQARRLGAGCSCGRRRRSCSPHFAQQARHQARRRVAVLRHQQVHYGIPLLPRGRRLVELRRQQRQQRGGELRVRHRAGVAPAPAHPRVVAARPWSKGGGGSAAQSTFLSAKAARRACVRRRQVHHPLDGLVEEEVCARVRLGRWLCCRACHRPTTARVAEPSQHTSSPDAGVQACRRAYRE